MFESITTLHFIYGDMNQSYFKIRKIILNILNTGLCWKKVQVGKDQEKAQSERDSHSKNRGGKKTN